MNRKQFDRISTEYMRSIEKSNLAEATVRNRATIIGAFFVYLDENEVNQIDKLAIEGWRQDLVSTGKSFSSVAQYMRELSLCFKWGIEMGFIKEENPVIQKFKKRPKKRGYTNLLTEEEYLQILYAEIPLHYIQKTETKDIRSAWYQNRAIVVLLLTSAIRNSEARLLTPSNLNYKENYIKILHGKGDKYRIVPFDSLAQDAIKDYLKYGPRPKTAKDTDVLFGQISRQTGEWEPMSRQWFSEIVERHVKKITGHDKEKSHALRHAGASAMVRGGVNIKDLQVVLGHENLETTAIYVDQLSTDVNPVLDIMKKYRAVATGSSNDTENIEDLRARLAQAEAELAARKGVLI